VCWCIAGRGERERALRQAGAALLMETDVDGVKAVFVRVARLLLRPRYRVGSKPPGATRGRDHGENEPIRGGQQ